jgi:hypothetical protein
VHDHVGYVWTRAPNALLDLAGTRMGFGEWARGIEA